MSQGSHQSGPTRFMPTSPADATARYRVVDEMSVPDGVEYAPFRSLSDAQDWIYNSAWVLIITRIAPDAARARGCAALVLKNELATALYMLPVRPPVSFGPGISGKFISVSAPDLTRHPHKCPRCGERAYVGMDVVQHAPDDKTECP